VRDETNGRNREGDHSLWLAAIVESSDDAIVSKDLDGIITSWNRGAERIFGYLAEEVIGKPVTILIPHDRDDEEPAILARLRRGERIDHYETVRRRKDGRLIDISLTVSPVMNGDGKIIGASKIARDITARKRNEAQIALLAREAEHRVKNVLATVEATVHLSQADTPEGLKRAIEGRIRALANAYGLFAKSQWAGADLHRMVTLELSPYCREEDRRARITGPSLTLEPRTAQAMAVVLHELATNAVKYGALSVADGSVAVEWSQAVDDRLTLRWIEANGPPVKPPSRQGFGMRMIETLIAGQLEGEVRFEWGPQGLSCEIEIAV
jgi:PAS domain S-box-containing protein